ncbi:hypothetical protein O181_129061 [Austropuccinia psidii MF-1]|uniref:Uncharacterized protein n=1 Tax=Austropuccinia psidii MF-1 TaxID=1389203 RepID=A0A9Q3L058_9BASI|nr:hypothetical protein [Austropuccinia psidii MF-1]
MGKLNTMKGIMGLDLSETDNTRLWEEERNSYLNLSTHESRQRQAFKHNKNEKINLNQEDNEQESLVKSSIDADFKKQQYGTNGKKGKKES